MDLLVVNRQYLKNEKPYLHMPDASKQRGKSHLSAKEFEHTLRIVLRLKQRIEIRLERLETYHDVYKIPPTVYKRNKMRYSSMLKSCNRILSMKYMEF